MQSGGMISSRENTNLEKNPGIYPIITFHKCVTLIQLLDIAWCELRIWSEHCVSYGSEVNIARATHCKENPIYVFLFWELRGLIPNFHIHVSVRDLYIPKIGPHISLQQNRPTNPGNI